MAIQWFPGHMHTTQKALVKRLPEIDVVIELLDARLPGSSSNPLLASLAAGKPALKVLNKQDLADADDTALWLTHLNSGPDTRALALDASVAAPARAMLQACRALAPLRGGMVKPLRLLICGIPNVGKSTLVNALHQRRISKTGDEAGITRTEQKIQLASDVYLFDTPGMLWPRITVEQTGYHLAASGGIGRNAYDDVDVALALLANVRQRYGQRLQQRYALDTAVPVADWSDEALLHAVGKRRGGLLAGGQVNLQKAAEAAIDDFRSGAWGRITLETPAQFLAWQAQGQQAEAARVAHKAARSKRPTGALRGQRRPGSTAELVEQAEAEVGDPQQPKQ
jgi:ribosome biogenesis GTPase A